MEDCRSRVQTPLSCTDQATRKTKEDRIRAGEESRVKRQRKCKKCGNLGHILRLCTNPVSASFGEEEQQAAANAEENEAANAEDNEAAEQNVGANVEENKANGIAVPAAWYVCNLPLFYAFVLFCLV